MQVVLSTSFFPPVAYMQQIVKNEHIVVDIHENYVKQNLRNRCQIYTPNGVQDLIVPVVKGRSPQTPTHMLQIAYHEQWQVRMWRSIEAAYRSSPYFEHYEDELKPFFEHKHEFLWQYNRDILQTILPLIGLNPAKITYSTEYIESPEWTDARNTTAKKRPPLENPKNYIQVFNQKHGFVPNLSILDLLFCEGPNSVNCI